MFFLGVSEKLFLENISILIGGLSKGDIPHCCVVWIDILKFMRVLSRVHRWRRSNLFSVWHWYSLIPVLQWEFPFFLPSIFLFCHFCLCNLDQCSAHLCYLPFLSHLFYLPDICENTIYLSLYFWLTPLNTWAGILIFSCFTLPCSQICKTKTGIYINSGSQVLPFLGWWPYKAVLINHSWNGAQGDCSLRGLGECLCDAQD